LPIAFVVFGLRIPKLETYNSGAVPGDELWAAAGATEFAIEANPITSSVILAGPVPFQPLLRNNAQADTTQGFDVLRWPVIGCDSVIRICA
jgi:hypothetical protein